MSSKYPLNAKPSGTAPDASPDAIVQMELDKLEGHRWKLKEDNEKYINEHPELQTLIDNFISAIITAKPTNIIKFGGEYFDAVASGGPQGPPPLVFAGPSGVGKGTIVSNLMKKFPSVFGFSVSHTTRAPREGEENGVHYHFVTKDKMEAMIAQGEFIEHASVHTNMYGTSFSAVEQVRGQGKICILDIDVQGVQGIKKSNLNCKYLFISPPSIEELEKRLRGRGTETEEKIQVRLKNAIQELEFGNEPGNFDANVVNRDLNEALKDLISVLQTWYPDYPLFD